MINKSVNSSREDKLKHRKNDLKHGKRNKKHIFNFQEEEEKLLGKCYFHAKHAI